MSNLTYYLDKNNVNKKGLAPIKANIYIDKKNVTCIIDKVLPSDWNPKQQRVRPPRPDKENDQIRINEKLEKMEDDWKAFKRKCESDKIQLTHQIAKKFFSGDSLPTRKEMSFWEAYQEYLDSKIIVSKTLQNYKLYKIKLKEFEKETGYLIDYHTINLQFFDRYQKYILKDKKLSWNSFATAIKKLKFFMIWAAKREYHNESGFKKFSVTEKEPSVIFLTTQELNTLYNFNFNSQRLNSARDKFCFGCLTGLAFADLDTLTQEHINNGTLTKFRQKTKAKLEIELSDAALAILKRYSDKFHVLPKISSQRFNEYIKECCKIAGINTPTTYKDFTGGLVTEKIAPKYELVGSHTARKTFITNFYSNTKDYVLTKKNAGISQDKTMKRYIGSDKEIEKASMKKAFENIQLNQPVTDHRLDFVE